MKNVRLYLALALGLGLALIGLFAFGGLAAPLQQPADPTPSPAMNAHNAPRDSVVSIAYSEAINPATVSTDTFAVYAMQTGLLTEAYGVNGGTIALTPSDPFKPGELVQASATTGTLNLSGQGPISPTVWQFRAAVGGGVGTFANSGQTTAQLSGYAAALGDLNGDGYLDIYAANTTQDKVWLNDGTVSFTDGGWTASSSNSKDVALGDLNGDGWLDVFLVNTGAQDEAWLNVGGTGFALADSVGGATDDSLDVDLGDVDGDGDLDALVGTESGVNNKIWLNDGSGSFSSSLNLGTSPAEGVALGDLDGDGDLDAFLANYNVSDELWENLGPAGFSLKDSLGTAEYSVDVALGDVDGNGTLDAVVVSRSYLEDNVLWLNDGAWGFTRSSETFEQVRSEGVALGDLDGDGDLDVFVANRLADDTVWLNDGGFQGGTSGEFTLKASLPVNSSYNVVLGDLDGDGDLDAVPCAVSTYNFVWLNGDRADLTILKTVNLPFASPGQRITYTLTYTNLGPQTAKGIAISDTAPTELTDVQCSAVAGVITPTGGFDCEWEAADLGAGEGGTVYMSGVVGAGMAAGATFTNTAEIYSTRVADYRNDNDKSSMDVTVAHRIYLPLVVRNYP
jgi:uncharacterized repeat protein (TIGR01451 family)